MATEMVGLQETLPGLQQLVEGAELRRDEHSVEVLKKYVGLHLGDLLPLSGMICAHCFSEDTQLLTEEGWKGIDEVEIGTSLATFNPAKGSIEYYPAVNKFVYEYAGEMYKMESSCADHLVTPNHTMLYESYGTWKECLAEDFFVKGAHV